MLLGDSLEELCSVVACLANTLSAGCRAEDNALGTIADWLSVAVNWQQVLSSADNVLPGSYSQTLSVMQGDMGQSSPRSRHQQLPALQQVCVLPWKYYFSKALLCFGHLHAACSMGVSRSALTAACV